MTAFLICFYLSSFISFSQEAFIQNGDTWNYFDNGYLKNDWFKNKNFTDWKVGESPLGYGDRSIVTKLSFGDDEE